MDATIIVISISVFILLSLLTVLTIRSFRRMNKVPAEFTGSDKMAGTAE